VLHYALGHELRLQISWPLELTEIFVFFVLYRKGQNILNHIELIILVSIHRGLHKLSLSQIEKVRVMFREPKFVPRALRMQRILMVNEDRKEQKALQLCKVILISTQFVNVKNKRSSYCTTAFLSINVIYRTLTLYNF
jgi:hypothetical protein